MCKDATIVARAQFESNPSKGEEVSLVDTGDIAEAAVDEQSRMLCNTIVRATYELHANQRKSAGEIQAFLKNDCQLLSTAELIRKVSLRETLECPRSYHICLPLVRAVSRSTWRRYLQPCC
jgi:hypothetical protein